MQNFLKFIKNNSLISIQKIKLHIIHCNLKFSLEERNTHLKMFPEKHSDDIF